MGYSSSSGFTAPFTLSDVASRIGHSGSKTLSAILNSSNYYKLAVNKPVNSDLTTSKGLEIGSYSSGSALYNSGGTWSYPTGPTRSANNMGQLAGYCDNTWREGETVSGRYRVPFGYFTYSGAGSFWSPSLKLSSDSDYPKYLFTLLNSWDFGSGGAKSPLNISDFSSALNLSSSYVGVALLTSNAYYVKTLATAGATSGTIEVSPSYSFLSSNEIRFIPIISPSKQSSGSYTFTSGTKTLGSSFDVSPNTINVEVVCNDYAWYDDAPPSAEARGTVIVKNLSPHAGSVILEIRFNPTGGYVNQKTELIEFSMGNSQRSVSFDFTWDYIASGAVSNGYARIIAGSNSVTYSGSSLDSSGGFREY